jgi:hypothetical protein
MSGAYRQPIVILDDRTSFINEALPSYPPLLLSSPPIPDLHRGLLEPTPLITATQPKNSLAYSRGQLLAHMLPLLITQAGT